MTEIINAPELRFPEFKDEWIEKAFGDFTKTNQGLQIAISNRETQYKEGYYFYITNEFLKPNNKIKYYIKNPPNSVIANKDDILMTRTGNTGKVITGVHGAFHNNFFKIKFDNKQYDRLFIYELLKSSKINNKILSLAGTSTIPDLNHSDFYSIKSFIPKYEEQQKLGIFFSKLDRQIELEEEKLELLEQQKRGYMQKIFSQDLRFKDENGNVYPKWVTQKIKELGNVYTGNTPSKKQSMYWNSNNYIWVTPTDINNKKDLKNSEYMLSDEGFKKARQLPKNTLLITCIASIGKNAILREEGSCNQQINALVPNSDKNVDFLYYAFEKVSKYMKRIAGKTATQIVNKSTFENISIEVPNFEEQLKVGRFLNSFDKLIEKQVSKIELLKQRKQGFLQKMFV
ncbi:restriction endonuclease subunit S [Staphylococcus capitis]|uniref:restriction endonuclease subunit S n=1 Tax=Staphylococcus TaxID=1279 RepID=UPI0001929446|nr:MULTISPECIES: restriction endonuclease subunit S [Staphylococcus]EEE49382.1 type I restriction modification DNA specificity domain protein [Staphylococcus capitis SK14]EGS40091.1 type I restriction modification DNA specificity domain protein [Staphylococcus capitis VCU116]MBF2261873.1 restriction endonuclease subunit S [Staphylococcus capitis]MBF2282680.1 restriction endonuclease subunit S [Staphylococcus capitis]MBN6785189.1 restriction endonuclease subunit S [Staphylococcus capitis]